MGIIKAHMANTPVLIITGASVPQQKDDGGRGQLSQLFGGKHQVMGQVVGPRREIQAARRNAGQHVICGATELQNAGGGNSGVAGRGARDLQVMIRTKLLDPQDEGLAQPAAARYGAKAGLPGKQAARRAGVDQFPGHGDCRLRRSIPARHQVRREKVY